ncbi:hypothetical protein N7478_007085 [Penicillium angulare]|uniref:uncharacterized protein n=1 Tax=Penicillium angulare TaxID=116970 RepID=UPI0025403B88|nr:uncharacterized protein N7478_007085 [Penicillium angulare]KAJ5281713.1 hypothetical protein N7478_007085 [Penicillium angulare]
MDKYNSHRPPSSVRSLVNTSSFHHVAPTVTPPASPPSYPSHPPASYPISPPSTRASIASVKTNNTNFANEQRKPHTNPIIEATNLRAQDEQDMQSILHNVQLSCQIWNAEIEPEHETTDLCDCAVHKYYKKKIDRLEVQEIWSKAVLYPGEKSYHDCTHLRLFNNNPYSTEIISPYGFGGVALSKIARANPEYHVEFLHQTIALNTTLNAKAKIAVQALEPSFNIWDLEQLESLVKNMSGPRATPDDDTHDHKLSKRATFKKALSVKTSDERAAGKIKKKFSGGFELREAILKEENGRWQNECDKGIVQSYQQVIGISSQINELRKNHPLQYLHLLRAGYFEPIPIAWTRDSQTSNVLKFSIDAAVGWRGITPAWRGYETTAEERLYWVLSHRNGGGVVMKPDIVSALDTARARMASAVEIPPAYHSTDDTCHIQNTSQGYSKQVRNTFRSWSGALSRMDETMILLDASGSMEFNPARPKYNKYLITGFSKVDLAKAIISRFVDAMQTFSNSSYGYHLVTFSNQASDIGLVNRWNINQIWGNVQFGGRTRIMTGWSKIKELHFQKHSQTAKYHPTYGWQAGPETPSLRLVLILDGEANDMDEFELDLLSLSWAYVTIFLIGVEGSLNHHRHANRLQRISEINPRVSFVEAQGNISERFVLHELLKRHIGREIPMSELRDLEQSTAELPSPQQVRQERHPSVGVQIEQTPVELPSLEETRHWQVRQQHGSALVELRADRDPIELPATETLSISPTSGRYSPFPPPDRPLPPLPALPRLQRPSPLHPEQSPQGPLPPYFENFIR